MRPLITVRRSLFIFCSNRAVRLTALFKIALMIFFGAPEPWRWLDLRPDWPIETSSLFQLVFRGFGDGLLVRRMVKDHRTILLSNIGTLPIQRRRIVVRPENIKQLFVTNLRWIEFDFHHFSVAGLVCANIFIGWIILRSACVSNRCRDDAVQFSKCLFHTPETACAKGGLLSFHTGHDGTIVRGTQPSLPVPFCCLTVATRRIRIALKSHSQPPKNVASARQSFSSNEFLCHHPRADSLSVAGTASQWLGSTAGENANSAHSSPCP